MKMEALWVLSNLCYGSQDDLEKIFSPQYDLLGCVEIYLNSSDRAFVEQTLWVLGNMSGESKEFRDLIIH